MGTAIKPTENLTLLLILLGGIYLFLGGNRGMWNLYKMHQEKIQLQREVEGLKRDIQRDQVEYKAYQNDPAVIEKQAREELNLVKPGETIYRFSRDPGGK